MRQRSMGRPVARMAAWAAASGEMRRNGTHWQRETIVGRMVSAEVPSRMNVTFAGGSSRVLSSAFAELARSWSARSMM